VPILTAPALPVSAEQRAELRRMARSTLLPHRKVVQARALLMAADGMANQQIARRCEVDSDTVRRWRDRFVHGGPGGVGVIAKGRGRKPSLPAGTVAEVLRLTHERPADGSTHWSTRSMAARVGIGKDAVARIWADHGLKPWRVAAVVDFRDHLTRRRPTALRLPQVTGTTCWSFAQSVCAA